MTDRNTDDPTDSIDDESPDASEDDSEEEPDVSEDDRNEADDPADVGEGHDYDVGEQHAEGHNDDTEEHDTDTEGHDTDTEGHDTDTEFIDSDDPNRDVGSEDSNEREDGFDRQNGFERKNATGREDGFEHENAIEHDDTVEREDGLVHDEREEGVEASDPLGEPAHVADEYGEPPQYFDPADESTAASSSSGASSFADMIGLQSSDERSTDWDRDGNEPSSSAGLERARKVGTALDDAVTIPGTSFKIGLDPILGILPGAGDAVAAVGSLYIVLEAARAGVPRGTLKKMLALVAVDLVAGSVPLIGVLFDAFWKANKWNVAAFEEHVHGDGA